MLCRRLPLIIIAAVMLLLALLGFCKTMDCLNLMITFSNWPTKIVFSHIVVIINCSVFSFQPKVSCLHVSVLPTIFFPYEILFRLFKAV